MTDTLVIVFVKNIKLGTVKTRLAKTIGDFGAFEVYTELVKITEKATEALVRYRTRMTTEMSESGEVFEFPGINSDSYDSIKAEQEEYPGYTTPIDELLERFNNEGFKILRQVCHGGI